MRILSVGNFGTGWDGSICDEEHVAKALEELGHEVARCQRDHIEFTDGGQWDFTLISQWDNYPDEALALLPHPLIYWAFDHQDQYQEWHLRLIDAADLYLSKRIEDSRFDNWQWLPQDFAPAFLDKFPENIEKNIDVLFTGSYLPWAEERNATLKAVDDAFNLTIYSVTPDEFRNRGFKNVFGPEMDEALPELIARSKINLSIDHTIEAGYWSDRPAQIMACGGFVLHRYQPLSTTVFRNHIAYFYSIEDCLNKLSNLLRPDIAAIREDFAKNAYEYAQANLMVKNRVMDLLTIVEEIL